MLAINPQIHIEERTTGIRLGCGNASVSSGAGGITALTGRDTGINPSPAGRGWREAPGEGFTKGWLIATTTVDTCGGAVIAAGRHGIWLPRLTSSENGITNFVEATSHSR